MPGWERCRAGGSWLCPESGFGPSLAQTGTGGFLASPFRMPCLTAPGSLSPVWLQLGEWGGDPGGILWTLGVTLGSCTCRLSSAFFQFRRCGCWNSSLCRHLCVCVCVSGLGEAAQASQGPLQCCLPESPEGRPKGHPEDAGRVLGTGRIFPLCPGPVWLTLLYKITLGAL